jgi:hypothetical protein
MNAWTPGLSFFGQSYPSDPTPTVEQYGLLDADTKMLDHPFSDFLSSGQPHALPQSYNALPSYLGQGHDKTLVRNTEFVPSSPMAPPTKPRKKKAPTLHAEDWEPYKKRILELYIDKATPLPEVKVIIESEFGFKAESVFPQPNHLAHYS